VQFGDQVRILREAQRISQNELARRLDLATATISSYEQGSRMTRRYARLVPGDALLPGAGPVQALGLDARTPRR
jgi:transcriptional regulator with XRE-family HTH domain